MDIQLEIKLKKRNMEVDHGGGEKRLDHWRDFCLYSVR